MCLIYMYACKYLCVCVCVHINDLQVRYRPRNFAVIDFQLFCACTLRNITLVILCCCCCCCLFLIGAGVELIGNLRGYIYNYRPEGGNFDEPERIMRMKRDKI